MRRPPDAAAFARIPDAPEWIDTRGILESGRGEIVRPPQADPRQGGLLVVLAERGVISVVPAVPAPLLGDTIAGLQGDVNVLCQPGEAKGVAAALPDWRQRTALLHVLAGTVAWRDGSEPDTTFLDSAHPPALDHVPGALRAELAAALAGRPTTRFVAGQLPPPDAAAPARPVAIAAAWSDGKPVAFCYAVTETATWWDVSVDTVPAWRRRGLAGRAARAMIRAHWTEGKSPVWGAMEDNAASRGLALQLGFIEIARLAVFTKG